MKYCKDEQVQKDETGAACSTHGKHEYVKVVKDFGWKT
jgi:hypothetical protein